MTTNGFSQKAISQKAFRDLLSLTEIMEKLYSAGFVSQRRIWRRIIIISRRLKKLSQMYQERSISPFFFDKVVADVNTLDEESRKLAMPDFNFLKKSCDRIVALFNEIIFPEEVCP